MNTDKFIEHKLEIHVEPEAVDIIVRKCNVCQAEYLTEKNLLKHFASKHKDAPVEFVVVKSGKTVKCSNCSERIKTKNFPRHKPKCISGRRPINVSERKATETGGQENVASASNLWESVNESNFWELVNETFGDDGFRMKTLTKELETLNVKPHTTAPTLFACNHCAGSNILEQNLAKHLVKHHFTISNRNSFLNSLSNDFRLLGPKEQVRRLQCKVCKVYFKENLLVSHFRRVHAMPFVEGESEPATTYRSGESPIRYNTREQFRVTIKVYKCLACDARDIMEPNIVRHHLKKHARIPFDINIFEMTGQTLREKCNICRRCLPEGRLKAHKRRSHHNRLVLSDQQFVDVSRSKGTYKPMVIQDIEPVRMELHKCLKCRATVDKDKLQIHRKHHAGEVSNLFKLIGTKDVIKCAVCLDLILPENFKHHITRHKTTIFVSVDGLPLFHTKSENEQMKIKPNELRPKNQFLPKYRNVYKCRACKIINGKDKFIPDTASNGWAIQQHERTHRNHSIQGNIFQLDVVQVKCNVCDQYMKDARVEKHMKSVHKWNYDLNFVRLYKCGGCEANGISRRNLPAHHSRMHNFPIERNDFKICGLKQKIECNFCRKRFMEGREEKHRLRACLQRASTIKTALNEQKVFDA